MSDFEERLTSKATKAKWDTPKYERTSLSDAFGRFSPPAAPLDSVAGYS